MKHHLNTLFVTTQGAYLSKDGQSVAVKVEGETRLRVPIHTLGSVVCFGRIGVSPALLGLCGSSGVAFSFLTEHGRFLARASGFTPGNVLLRREQYRRADDLAACAAIASSMLAAKVANARAVILRALRDRPGAAGAGELQSAAVRLASAVTDIRGSSNLDSLRGLEGDAANAYFGVFGHLITHPDTEAFRFTLRSRRPPLDRVNCLLSFLYALLAGDSRAACEAAGLDPAVGFLHRDRPGRPGLALDLMEEFRPFLCDRLALSLMNRGQVRADQFDCTESGAVLLSDKARKTVLIAYQERKQETVTHPFLEEKMSVGLLVHIQARLLARHLRNDLDAYPAFIWK